MYINIVSAEQKGDDNADFLHCVAPTRIKL
jgi:hypothetical protein